VPKETAAATKKVAQEEGFASVSEYFRHLLREENRRKLAKELEAQTKQFEQGKGKLLRSLRDLR